ncbi:MAG TPA: tyrosine--tRNA ligase [Myxococcota bacterium]
MQSLRRGAVDLEVEAELRKKLERSRVDKKQLSVKLGADPTAPDLHLGHTVVLNKMRQFQLLGHKVVFLIGDFTARIGDPTGKSATRPPLSEDEIMANAATYRRQVFKILDEEKTEIRFNSEWLSKLGFDDVIRLAAKHSLARMLERDDFDKRLKEHTPISMHEILYPLAQGYDSVALKSDVELGGTDQRFNLLVGRDLMRGYGLEPQCILTTPILVGLDGEKKMSKSLGNYIGVEEDARSQFGKTMSISDALMWDWFTLISDKSIADVEILKKGHPRDAKMALAKEIVARFHSEAAAQHEHEEWIRRINAKDQLPDHAPTFTIDAAGQPGVPLVRLLVETNLVPSNGEARRQITQGGVYLDGERLTDPKAVVPVGTHGLRKGNLGWARVILR